MHNYLFSKHLINESLPARGLTVEQAVDAIETGSSWSNRHYNNMRSRKDDLIVAWDRVGDKRFIITVWDGTKDIPSREVN
ncbi:MAG: hypothetical protein ACR2PH_16530 [Desulfobulbia bacterium]